MSNGANPHNIRREPTFREDVRVGALACGLGSCAFLKAAGQGSGVRGQGSWRCRPEREVGRVPHLACDFCRSGGGQTARPRWAFPVPDPKPPLALQGRSGPFRCGLSSVLKRSHRPPAASHPRLPPLRPAGVPWLWLASGPPVQRTGGLTFLWLQMPLRPRPHQVGPARLQAPHLPGPVRVEAWAAPSHLGSSPPCP